MSILYIEVGACEGDRGGRRNLIPRYRIAGHGFVSRRDLEISIKTYVHYLHYLNKGVYAPINLRAKERKSTTCLGGYGVARPVPIAWISKIFQGGRGCQVVEKRMKKEQGLKMAWPGNKSTGGIEIDPVEDSDPGPRRSRPHCSLHMRSMTWCFTLALCPSSRGSGRWWWWLCCDSRR